jgi:hypothetical protein
MTDFNHIPARHDAINLRLEEWSRWVRCKPQAWAMQPMFRLYRAPKQWESDLQIRIEIDTLAAHEIERAVSFLPDKHRTALRWFYVHSHVPVNAVRRELGVTRDGLGQLINDGRSMLINRLKQNMVDAG